MAFVKVRNLNTYPYHEKFKGKDITIPPGETIEMDEEEAPEFLGTFTHFKRDNKGQDLPEYFKKLKIEKDPSHVVKDPIANKYLCNVCREQTSSWIELEAHMRLMHSDQLVRDADYEKAQKAKDHGAKAAGAGVSPQR